MSKSRDSIEDLRTIDADLAAKAPLASPSFTGTVTADGLVVDGGAAVNGSNDSATNYLNGDATLLVSNTAGTNTTNLKLENDAAIVYGGGANTLVITDRQNERLRINSSGNVLVGTTSNSVQNARQYIVHPAANAGIQIQPDALSSGSTYAFFNNEAGGVIGAITRSGTSSAVQYLTSSDYRLKELDVPMTGATERVKELRPVNFAWKVDGKRVDGFYAHELQAVVPEAASGTKDAMRDEEYEVSVATGDVFTAGSEAGFTEVSPAISASPAYYDVDGNVIKAEVIAQAAVHEAYEAIAEVTHSADVEQPETLEEGQQWRETTAAVMGTRSVPYMQGIDQSKLVPLLTATIQELIVAKEDQATTIQELIARIESLETPPI